MGHPEKPSLRKESFTLRAYECDRRGYASILTMCNFMQEAAGNHAAALGLSLENLQVKDLTWVLSRLCVRVMAYPCWHEEVEVETWPSAAGRLFAFRDFEISGAQRRYVVAASAWVLMDVRSRRPVRMLPIIEEVLPLERGRAPQEQFLDRLVAPAEETNKCSFRVRWLDIDANRHVNNVHYLAWALETVPQDIRRSWQLQELRVEFLDESVLGDQVVAFCDRAPGEAQPVFRHEVRRERDGRRLTVLRTAWSRNLQG